jgi:2-oxo-4-hydroxy-4-carboxy--5-ureidoimidazoline (OHCU) decarboxylase|tara:strand:+ start:147 stop:488 length:342 start_codon:yes stop_codon:yes gene_type:complete
MTFTTGLPLKTKIKTNVTKKEILAKASDLISNDRNKSHGDAFNNHAEIAEFWNIFLDKKLNPMASITADDVAIMMILLKISRHTQGDKNNMDNFVDMAGYAAIAGEISDAGSF